MGELWGVYFEEVGENLPRYNGTALYAQNFVEYFVSYQKENNVADIWFQIFLIPKSTVSSFRFRL